MNSTINIILIIIIAAYFIFSYFESRKLYRLLTAILLLSSLLLYVPFFKEADSIVKYTLIGFYIILTSIIMFLFGREMGSSRKSRK